MLTLISRGLGLVICVGLMLVGAKHTAIKVWDWRKSYNAQSKSAA